jgi:Flp pilus assembly protein TadG
MFLITCFFLGIGNFAMHKAVVESGHPFVEDTKRYFGAYFGRNGSYLVEFAILAGAMLMAFGGSGWIVAVYTLYTSFNALSAWLLLSGKF